MTSRYSAKYWLTMSFQSRPVFCIFSMIRSSMSGTFWRYNTWYPLCRRNRATTSNATYVFAWPMCVSSCGVRPQTNMDTRFAWRGTSSSFVLDNVLYTRMGIARSASRRRVLRFLKGDGRTLLGRSVCQLVRAFDAQVLWTLGPPCWDDHARSDSNAACLRGSPVLGLRPPTSRAPSRRERRPLRVLARCRSMGRFPPGLRVPLRGRSPRVDRGRRLCLGLADPLGRVAGPPSPAAYGFQRRRGLASVLAHPPCGGRYGRRFGAPVPRPRIGGHVDLHRVLVRLALRRLVARANPRPPWNHLWPRRSFPRTPFPISHGPRSAHPPRRRRCNDRDHPPESRDERLRSSMELGTRGAARRRAGGLRADQFRNDRPLDDREGADPDDAGSPARGFSRAPVRGLPLGRGRPRVRSRIVPSRP